MTMFVLRVSAIAPTSDMAIPSKTEKLNTS